MITYEFWYIGREHPSHELGMVEADTPEAAMAFLVARDEKESAAVDRRNRRGRREPRIDPSTIEARPHVPRTAMIAMATTMGDESAAIADEALAYERRTGRSIKTGGGAGDYLDSKP